MIDSIWANSIVDQCLQNGIDHFFLAPGSRCTPLTLAVARRNDVAVTQHFDERGLAFATLGYGRATGKPGVFICTSGTAVANALPAVIEASTEAVPLLIFTADRPAELHGTGANQTIDQFEIFGRYPNLFVNMSVPGDCDSADDPNGLTFLSQQLARGINSALRGPVHLNWMFREPFSIDDQERVPLNENSSLERSSSQCVSRHPTVNIQGNTLIALGGCRPNEAESAQRLSELLNCPILSDVTSGLSTGSLEIPSEFDLPKPDTILHLGGRLVSKSWHQWTAKLADADVAFIHLTSTGKTVNPNRLASKQYNMPLLNLATQVAGPRTGDEFCAAWCRAVTARTDVLRRVLGNAHSLNEPAIAYSIGQRCPPSHGLFVGNSTPIRDMDWYGIGERKTVRNVAANRGASGIDGLIATASGYAAGLDRPTTVLLGDLSALHDLNSLPLVANSSVPMIIVIINNRGGHIFDLLPIRKSKHFEKFFATPHAFGFEDAAKMFGLNYRRISQPVDFNESYLDALSRNQTIVLELMTDRQQNLEVRHQIREEIRRCSS